MDTTETKDTVIRLTGYRDVAETFSPPSKTATTQSSYDTVAHLHDTLVTLDGEPHYRRRRVEMPLFKASTVRKYEEELFPELARRAFDAFAAADDLDLVRIALAVQLQFAAKLVGLTAWETIDDSFALYDRIQPLMQMAIIRHTNRSKDELVAEAMAAARGFDETHFRPAFDDRRAVRDNGGSLPDDDLLNILVTAQPDHEEFDDGLVLREAMLFVNGAAFTTSATLVHAFHELHRWIDQHPDAAAKIDDLGFLQQIVHETIRLHPATRSQFRRIEEEVALSSGRVLHPGERVELDMGAANLDPEIWGDDAAEFRPGRERPAGIPAYGVAFGFGPHACIGRVLAAGTVPREGDENAIPQYGSVARTLALLLEWGARPDPERAPEKDVRTLRDEYARYPIVRVPAGVPAV